MGPCPASRTASGCEVRCPGRAPGAWGAGPRKPAPKPSRSGSLFCVLEQGRPGSPRLDAPASNAKQCAGAGRGGQPAVAEARPSTAGREGASGPWCQAPTPATYGTGSTRWAPMLPGTPPLRRSWLEFQVLAAGHARSSPLSPPLWPQEFPVDDSLPPHFTWPPLGHLVSSSSLGPLVK